MRYLCVFTLISLFVYILLLSYEIRYRCNNESVPIDRSILNRSQGRLVVTRSARGTQDKSGRDKFSRQAPSGTGSGTPRGVEREQAE